MTDILGIIKTQREVRGWSEYDDTYAYTWRRLWLSLFCGKRG